MSISKNNLLIGALVLVVAIIVIGAGGYLIYSQSNPVEETHHHDSDSSSHDSAIPSPTPVENPEQATEADPSETGAQVLDPDSEEASRMVESAMDASQASQSAHEH